MMMITDTQELRDKCEITSIVTAIFITNKRDAIGQRAKS